MLVFVGGGLYASKFRKQNISQGLLLTTRKVKWTMFQNKSPFEVELRKEFGNI